MPRELRGYVPETGGFRPVFAGLGGDSGMLCSRQGNLRSQGPSLPGRLHVEVYLLLMPPNLLRMYPLSFSDSAAEKKFTLLA
ncbi:hypothetical protein PF005_g27148 [Phytophthora fragariae]|uniref:Uncharacterized protein n=1 Tax=Phytophthora fragariae TaxID=53985 RepID=A0A6A3HNI0_9STRA|nr:hypothetical protein PF009_g5978 [Phytophthora fragariae]KAE8971191.1 hypothetical protein PF011_g26124 [Phytophthora fragariae]KAE9069798.1 hypothetical protein PF007_g27173 [Phytophthora fragariae]KAE9070872.1 hypothetical protein PF010_g26100 [Phytophthora fragariae]KAE9083474.1 hypothetical protein PF006_g26682 [Phytophthora fragariae]